MDRTLQRLHDRLRCAIDGLSCGDLVCRQEGKWCAAEILEHLNLTYTGTIRNLERRLSEGKPSATPRGGRLWQRLLLTRLGYFPRGRQSPERVRPRGAPHDQVVADIFHNLEKMDRMIAECEKRFGRRTPVADHPILGPLTAAEWRGFHLTHGKHHARQMRN